MCSSLLPDRIYWTQIAATLAATIGSVSDGIQYAWTSPILPMLKKPESPIPNVTDSDDFWLESMYLIGGLAGLPLTKYSLDKFGRKVSILIAGCNNFLAWILIAVAGNKEMLYVARFVAGVAGDVAFVSVPMYLAEIADQKIRGRLISLIYVMVLIGANICYCVGPFVSLLVSSSVGGAFIITQLITFSFMPETPYYYLLKNKEAEAEKSLKWLRPNSNIQSELNDIKSAVARQSADKSRAKDLFIVDSNRKAMVIMTVLNASQHMAGITVMIMNLHSILDDAKGIISANPAAIAFAMIMLAGTLIGVTMIDRFGRKVLLITSSLGTSITLCLLAIYFVLKHHSYDVSMVTWLPVACVFIYAIIFKIGLGLVPIVITGELFPTNVKALGMTLADAMYVIFGTLSIFIYESLKNTFGLQTPFFVFSASCLLTGLFTQVYIPETKGRTLEQIQYLLKEDRS